MCGILGGIAPGISLEAINLMSVSLRHRGPDDEGIFIEGAVFLGHRRLSIIDLAAGQQPMSSIDKRQNIIFNGEIYNYRQIREELISKGHVFLTQSDTEVILNAYREWGKECLHPFTCIFSFALWDANIKALWLVRDRLGKKPLYYLQCQGAFFFSSEAKALWKAPGFDGRHDLRGIDQYLTYRYIPSEKTFYQQIKKLPAGHWMLINEKSQIEKMYQWWDLPQAREKNFSTERSLQSYQDQFHSLFVDAVRLRLVSDVPVGLFLSSGIDSVAVASEIASVSRPIFFTMGVGAQLDEVPSANRLARHFGGEHHAIDMKVEDFDLFPHIVAMMDEPYGDAIVVPTYLLAQHAASKVKVVLTGDGADEILGGYVHQQALRKFPQGLPYPLKRLLAASIRRTPISILDHFFHYPASMGPQGRLRLAELFSVGDDHLEMVKNFTELFSREERNQLYSEDFKRALENESNDLDQEMRAHFFEKDLSIFDKVLRWDLKHWFPEQTLMKLDRLTMAHSLEGRCPFADHHLLEFLFQ